MNGRELPLAQIRRWSKVIRDVDLTSLPAPELPTLDSSVRNVLDILKNVTQSGLSPDRTPQNQLGNWLDSIEQGSAHTLRAVALLVPYWILESSRFQDIQQEATATLSNITTVSKKIEEYSEKVEAEIQATVAPLYRTVSDSAIGIHSHHFNAAMDNHQAAATRWLKITGAMALLTLSVSAGFVFLAYRGADKDNVWAIGIAKALLVSLLLSATIWAGRVYKAHIHNVVVNRHRRDALNTYLAFSKVEMSPEVRNATLAAVTQCIFSHQPSGYDDGPSDKDSSRAIELAKAISGK